MILLASHVKRSQMKTATKNEDDDNNNTEGSQYKHQGCHQIHTHTTQSPSRTTILI